MKNIKYAVVKIPVLDLSVEDECIEITEKYETVVLENFFLPSKYSIDQVAEFINDEIWDGTVDAMTVQVAEVKEDI
jgi:hypothetical protein